MFSGRCNICISKYAGALAFIVVAGFEIVTLLHVKPTTSSASGIPTPSQMLNRSAYDLEAEHHNLFFFASSIYPPAYLDFSSGTVQQSRLVDKLPTSGSTLGSRTASEPGKETTANPIVTLDFTDGQVQKRRKGRLASER